ncbi:MAG: hypothetical protein JJ863_21570 [Deltaproteobacteria bacterium]|nr:hypothetical protein [Deltaproteobacteria bacterium]
MTNEEKAAEKRSKLVGAINEAAAKMAATQARVDTAREGMAKVVHAARCEMGTAKSEHLKAALEYSAARRRLLEALPSVDIESVTVALEAERTKFDEDLDEVLGASAQ